MQTTIMPRKPQESSRRQNSMTTMPQPTDTPSETQFQVTLADTGESYRCKPDETALVSLARSGRKGIPVGCRGGGCGVCKVAVLQGDYVRKPMSRSHVSVEDEQARRVLACCILPQSDLLLQVIGKLNKAICRPL